MHKVQRMDPIIGPAHCLTCGRGNTPDDPDTLDDFWVMDLERDVNWGDPAYICMYCCAKIAEHCGHVPLDAYEEREAIIRQHLETIHTLEAERDSLRRRFRVAKAGSKSVKSTRARESTRS